MRQLMRRSDFNYPLPAELIAQAPLAQRSASRLLVLDGSGGTLADRQMRELPGLLRGGDLLVFNDTKVLPARLAARRATGGQVEVFLERALEADGALVQLRASNPLRAGEALTSTGGAAPLGARPGRILEVRPAAPAVPLLLLVCCVGPPPRSD